RGAEGGAGKEGAGGKQVWGVGDPPPQPYHQLSPPAYKGITGVQQPDNGPWVHDQGDHRGDGEHRTPGNWSSVLVCRQSRRKQDQIGGRVTHTISHIKASDTAIWNREPLLKEPKSQCFSQSAGRQGHAKRGCVV